jgi:hypothetical protein
MARLSRITLLTTSPLVALFSVAACGGPTAPPAAPPAPPAPVAEAPPPPPALPAALPSSDDDDPNESADPIALVPEITRPWDKSTFPAKLGDEEKCWQTINVSGDAQKDYDSLTASCGAPLGLREYAKPAHGHLHSVKDKRDTFSIKLLKGLCYRYFAVGDSGIKDIDILVEKKGNVLVGDDKQNGPVAIIDASKSWCMNEDAEYFFNVEVDGEGHGKYVFGTWARPK